MVEGRQVLKGLYCVFCDQHILCFTLCMMPVFITNTYETMCVCSVYSISLHPRRISAIIVLLSSHLLYNFHYFCLNSFTYRILSKMYVSSLMQSSSSIKPILVDWLIFQCAWHITIWSGSLQNPEVYGHLLFSVYLGDFTNWIERNFT